LGGFPRKGVDRAIEIRDTGRRAIENRGESGQHRDREYFEAKIKPLLNNSLVEFIGEIGYPNKDEFLGKALALLFPINWPEPFGQS
jgi:glycosyltransferase involved in cell wall biosynthesis